MHLWWSLSSACCVSWKWVTKFIWNPFEISMPTAWKIQMKFWFHLSIANSLWVSIHFRAYLFGEVPKIFVWDPKNLCLCKNWLFTWQEKEVKVEAHHTGIFVPLEKKIIIILVYNCVPACLSLSRCAFLFDCFPPWGWRSDGLRRRLLDRLGSC